MKFTAALALVGAASAKFDAMDPMEYEFMSYVAKFGKSYGTKQEYQFRFEQFKRHRAAMDEHNNQNGQTSTIGLNQFSDYTHEEIKKMLGYKNVSNTKVEDKTVHLDESNLADSIDWRAKGGVTPVKDQGRCGSCWSFSTTGAMEGAHFVATGDLLSLSESNLVDCSWMNHGCNGGLMDFAFQYAEKHPLETESDYPYKASTGLFACKYKKDLGKVAVKTYSDVPKSSSAQLKAYLNKGPVSVAIEADKPVFHGYTGGIITSDECGTGLDHGVLAVGYGVEDGQEYYIVKNSWTASWGEKGFVRIGIKDGAGICGIQLSASQPYTN